MGYNAGYGQQFGGNMFYPTSLAQTAAPVVGDAAPAPTFQFQQQYYGGYPQYNFGGYGGYPQYNSGGYGGYRGFQSGYYGR